MLSDLTKKLDSFLEIGVPFYDCMVMKNGKCIYRHANGFTDIESKNMPTGKELYHIYSCSKLITCVAALQLLERGKFSLCDHLSDYMPEFLEITVKTDKGILPSKKPILIQHLFTMTAGFSYSLDLPQLKKCIQETDGKCPTRETMKYLAKEPLEFEPGTIWNYSVCHDILAALVEIISGENFGEYVEKNIFAPLDMNHSTFKRNIIDESQIVDQYRFNTEKNVAVKTDKKNSFQIGKEYQSGGAGCISTVEDYMKFMEAIRIGNQILKAETVDLMSTNCLTQEQLKYYWHKEYGYGLGQRCPKDLQKSDFGWDGAAGAYYAIDRKNGIAVYVGTHILGHSKYNSIRSQILPIVQRSF